MNKACVFLNGRQDFTSFSKLHTDVKTNLCTISKAIWSKDENGNLFFEITADRFLRNMVRAIVGTLLEVGTKNITPEEVEQIIAKKDRSEAKHSAPGHALYLWKVKYPDFQ
jgi:tRNA pseudouridine38-40 synthase